MNAAIDTAPEPLVLAETRDGVCTLTMNRGDRFNPLSRAMIAALETELDRLAADKAARVVVLAANGRGFCAGHDLKELRAHPDAAWQRELFDACSRMMLKLTQLPQPVIARVHGIATAAGCQLVSMCDLAVAADTARFALPGVNVGVFCSTPAVGVARNIAAQARDGNAAHRRDDRRADGAGLGPRQPRRGRRRSRCRRRALHRDHQGEERAHRGAGQAGVLSADRPRACPARTSSPAKSWPATCSTPMPPRASTRSSQSARRAGTPDAGEPTFADVWHAITNPGFSPFSCAAPSPVLDLHQTAGRRCMRQYADVTRRKVKRRVGHGVFLN